MTRALPLVTHPAYSYPFPSNHRFPMEKFQLLHDYLIEKGIANANNIFRAGRAKQEVVELAHCNQYLQRLISNSLSYNEMRRLGLPWSNGLITRTLISPTGTLQTAYHALKHGIACHLAGGTHHAHYNFGSGFCALNDLAITARSLIHTGHVERVLIFDCDVHQGDGTATILEHDANIFTCSIHCEKNFPARKAKSNLDVAVAPKMQDDEYLEIVDNTLINLLESFQPNIVLYDAGVDVYSQDPLGLLNVSTQGIRERERLVLNHCVNHRIPIATVIGGGYDDDRIALAQRHAIVVEEAYRITNAA